MPFETFDKYLLLEKLAAGGMAEVWLARPRDFNHFVAIKLILPQFSSNPDFIQMFKTEAKIAANLRHSSIVGIHLFGQEKGRLFLVMDFVDGLNLRQIWQQLEKNKQKMDIKHAVFIAKEVAAGLEYAHKAIDNETGKPLNLIHRDLSPQNIMISFEGEVKIIDFGIAKAVNQDQTQAGVIKGKFSYMSPEQAEGEELDARTDIYSLGIILWELLTGERLFIGPNEAAILKKVRDGNIPPVTKINPDVPLPLEQIVNKCLAKNKNLRYPSAFHLHKDLNRFLNTAFPEYTRSDLALFLKSQFADVYSERRKKLIYYSQLKEELNPDEKTRTLTASQSEVLETLHEIPGGEHLLAESQKVDIQQIKVDPSPHPSKPPTPPTIRVNPATQASYLNRSVNQTQKTPVVPVHKTSREPSKSGLALIFLIGGAALFYWVIQDNLPSSWQLKRWVNHKNVPNAAKNVLKPSPQPAQNLPIMGQRQKAHEEPVEARSSTLVTIRSNPLGAQIRINDQIVGISPLKLPLPPGQKVNISLTKEGYLPYETQWLVPPNPVAIFEATLQPDVPKGYVTIQLIGAPSDVYVEVNGRRLSRQEWDLYPIPAKVPVKIVARSPFHNLEATETVLVAPLEKKVLRLALKRSASAP